MATPDSREKTLKVALSLLITLIIIGSAVVTATYAIGQKADRAELERKLDVASYDKDQKVQDDNIRVLYVAKAQHEKDISDLNRKMDVVISTLDRIEKKVEKLP